MKWLFGAAFSISALAGCGPGSGLYGKMKGINPIKLAGSGPDGEMKGAVPKAMKWLLGTAFYFGVGST
ncbi:hypothetical protein [Paenibacillus sp. FSL M7-0896]|uniref:hypothetical protein n=1 Tax=Paenibacillus sp. FSL M7-0896 TaxID=2921610 RepID=UPI0030DA1552